jgi:putative ABC transport system permease protein
MNWWQRWFNRSRLERQLDTELRDHFERLVADFHREGHDDGEARRRARLEFGGLDQVKESCRDVRGTRWFEETAQDIRYGLRGFRKSPGFTFAAILTLTLGVGSNLAIFNVVDALLLRPLPVPEASQLITLSRWISGNSSESFSYPQIRALADRSELFTSLAGVGSDLVYIGPSDRLEPAGAAWVSGRFFDTLGVTPVAGRLLAAADDEPGAAVVAVISHDYWMRRLAGDPSIVGKPLLVEGQPVSIVGITASGFAGATIGESADLTLAINARPVLQPENDSMVSADARWLRVIGRPVATLGRQQLQARLDVAWPQILAATTSTRLSPESRQRALSMTLRVEEGRNGTSRLRRDLGAPLAVAMALVTLVLLIACVNVANLLLARGATRTREIAMRLALGAGRPRILRQLLVESAVLACVGAAIGVGLAWAGSAGLVSLIAERAAGPDGSAMFLDVSPNWRVLMATALVVVTTTLAFGMVPAWRGAAISPAGALPSGRVAESHGRLASALIVVQVSLSLLLVIGAGLFTRSLHHLRTLDRGFVPGNVLLANFDPTRASLSSPALQAFNQSVLGEVQALPGADAVSMSAVTPLEGGGMSTPITVNGVSTGLNEVYFNVVAPRFFQIIGTPLLAGRDFTDRDDANGPAVTIANEAFVRRYLQAGDPLGQRVLMPGAQREMEIVGVVKNAVYETLRAEPPPTVYLSYLQTRGRPMTLVIDARAPIADVASAVRLSVQPKVPSKPLRIHTLATQVENSLFEERLMVLLTATFGSLALLLAAVGLYGLVSYSVAARTREIGVRLALGALPSQMLTMVLGGALRIVSGGIVIGLPAAWLLSRLIGRLVFGITPTDPMTIASAVVMLVIVGLAAAAMPARRAARLNPVTAIHVE